ncbi:MAG TPA: LacI family DNA-binding transcriptional regulator [Cyclobacteriaceae bacterium]
MSKNIRIKDIAQLAGVSVGTVDRVLHSRGQVSRAAYNKVMEILEKTGYKPNLIARTLGSNKTYFIAALVPDPSQDEYWGMSGLGVQHAIEEWEQYGVRVEPYFFDLYDTASFRTNSEKVLSANPDGVLAAPIFRDEASRFFEVCHAREIPFVVFNNNVPQAQPLSFIGQDLYQSGRVAAELLHLNRQPPGLFAILHIYDDIQRSTHLSEKEQGFKEYFDNLDHGQFNVLSLDLNYTHEPTLKNELAEVMSHRELKGILVTTSRGASIVSSMLEKKGKDDIRLVAYDLLKQNLHYLKKGVIDFLINQNVRQQAFTGVGQLANRLLFNKKVPATCLFPLEIITRQNLDSYLSANFH